MAVDFHIFVKAETSFEEFLNHVNDLLSHALVKVPSVDWELYRAIFLGLEITLYEAVDFDDDLGIEFSSYNFVIGFDLILGVIDEIYASDWLKLFPTIFASIVSKKLSCECLVLRNLQIPIVKYIAGSSD